MVEKESRRNYIDYSKKETPQVVKPEPVKNVAVNAPDAAPAVNPDTENTIEKVEADIVTKKFVNVASLNVRSTPDTYSNSNIVRCIPRDTEVNVIEEVGEFSKIGEDEYVMTMFLI